MQFGIGLNTRLENHTGLNPTLHSLGIGHFQTPEDNLQIIHQITQKIEFHIQNFNLLQFKAEYTQFWLHESQIIKIHNVENSDQEYQIVGIDNSGYLLAKNLKTGKNYSVDPAENRFDMMNGLILQK